LQARRVQLPAQIAQLMKDLSDAAKTDSLRRTSIEDKIHRKEQIQETWRSHIYAVERVWADAKKRSGSGDESSKTR